MDPAHVEDRSAQQEQRKKAAWNAKTIRILLLILIFSLVLPPAVVYQVKKWPWARLADQVLDAAPGVQHLRVRIFPLAILDHGFSFDYETPFESGPTHHHFNQRLVSLGFERGANSWQGVDTRHAYFRSAQREIGCNIYWRSGEAACLPAYGRPNCDPSVNIVYGGCFSTGQKNPSAYDRLAAAIFVIAAVEYAGMRRLVERFIDPRT